MPRRADARIVKYLYAALMQFGLCCTDALAADFPPKDAVPISVPLYLDKRPAGAVQMLVMPNQQESFVQAAPLLSMLKDLVPDDKLKALKAAATRGFVNLKDGPKGGVDLRFDETLIALVVTIASENKKKRALKSAAISMCPTRPSRRRARFRPI